MDTSSVRESLLSRRPIIDDRSQVVAYALSAVESPSATATTTNRESAKTLVDTLMVHGVDALVGGCDGLVTWSPVFFGTNLVELVPRDRIVLMLDFEKSIDSHLEQCFRAAADSGVAVGLRRYTKKDPRRPLLDRSRYVTIDVDQFENIDLRQLIRHVRAAGAVPIAERVDTPEHFERAADCGFERYEGDFFKSTDRVGSKRIDPARMSYFELLVILAKEGDLSEIATIVKRDPGLTVSLLRFVNSGDLTRSARVSSILDALALVGRAALCRWLTILLYAGGSVEGLKDPLLLTAVKRGRVLETACRIRAGATPINGSEDLAFLAGMLSLLDVALGVPMEDLLERLGVDDVVKNIVLSHRGPLGTLLDVEDALERASLDEAALQLEAFGFDIDEYVQLEREAFQWATGGEDTLLSM